MLPILTYFTSTTTPLDYAEPGRRDVMSVGQLIPSMQCADTRSIYWMDGAYIYIISRHTLTGWMDGSSMAYHSLFGSVGGSDSGIHKCTILNNGQRAGKSRKAGKQGKPAYMLFVPGYGLETGRSVMGS